MYIELNLYDEAANEHDTLKKVFEAIDMNVGGICVPPFFLPAVQQLIPSGIVVATPIDFPYGLQSSKVRAHGVLSSLRRGANAIDLVINSQHVVNNKWELIEQDVKTGLKICEDNSASLRAVINYRSIDLKMRKVLCGLLAQCGVEYVIPSPGHKVDSWADNLLVCHDMQRKHGVHCITNGGLFSQEHLQKVETAGIFGVKVNSIPALKVFSGV